MEKRIRTMAVIATILMGVSVFLLVASVPFQRLIAREIFGVSDDVIGILPQFPVMPFLNCMLRAGCVALLMICCGKKKGGIWLELLVLGLLALILPAINNLASQGYMVFLGRYGSAKLAANSVVSQISSYCLTPAGWSSVLAYVACGMSITFKTMSKKQAVEQS